MPIIFIYLLGYVYSNTILVGKNIKYLENTNHGIHISYLYDSIKTFCLLSLNSFLILR